MTTQKEGRYAKKDERNYTCHLESVAQYGRAAGIHCRAPQQISRGRALKRPKSTLGDVPEVLLIIEDDARDE